MRRPDDPVFGLLWLEDPGPKEFFAAQDRARRRARGGTEDDERELEHERAQARFRVRRLGSTW